MKFPKIDLKELIYGSFDGYEVVEEPKIYDTSRWSNWYSMVFKYNDKFYQTSYSVGATESQDESPYEYDDDEIDCIEVEPYEEIVIKYRTVIK